MLSINTSYTKRGDEKGRYLMRNFCQHKFETTKKSEMGLIKLKVLFFMYVLLVCWSTCIAGGIQDNLLYKEPQSEKIQHNISDALFSLILKLDWQVFIIFVDNTTFDISVKLSQQLINYGRIASLLRVHQTDAIPRFFHAENRKNYNNFVLFCGPTTTTYNLNAISKNRLISSSFSWLIILPDEIETWKARLKSIDVIKSENIIIMAPAPTSTPSKRIDYGIYKAMGTETHIHIYKVDTWSYLRGFTLNATLNRSRVSLKGSTLTLAIIHDPPYVALRETAQGLQATGLDIDALTLLANKLNFSYRFLRVYDNIYGDVLPNGSWTGLVGAIQRKEADFCLPTFSRTALRCTVVDISPPISSAFSMFLIHRPHTTLDYNTYMAPFSTLVWLLLLGATFTFSIAFAICATKSPYHVLGLWKTEEKADIIPRAFLSSISSITQRGFEPFPKEASSRVTVTTFFMLCLLLMGCYNSVLVALLAVDQSRMPFDSMASLIENDDYGVGYVKGSAYEELLKKMPSSGKPGVAYKLYEKVMKNPDNVVYSNKQGIDKAYNEKYAFFSWVDGLVYEIGQNCSYVFVTGKYMLANYGIAFPRHSPYIEEVSREILKLKEAGILQRLHQKYFPPLQSYCNPEKISKPLGFKHIFPLFLLIVCGSCLAIVIFAIEMIYYTLRKKMS